MALAAEQANEEETETINGSPWAGLERREVRRRYIPDRRAAERRKRYWWSVVFPIILGACLTAVISWGAYVTHVTYSISANYEKTFVHHIEAQADKNALVEHKLELIKKDYTGGINAIRKDMTTGFSEIRNIQNAMYRLLLVRERDRSESGEN